MPEKILVKRLRILFFWLFAIVVLCELAIYILHIRDLFQAPVDPLKKQAAEDVAVLQTEFKLYRSLNGFYPTTEQGVKALVSKPKTNPIPTQWHAFLNESPSDPWGNSYSYRAPGIHNPQSFDIYSSGPDKKPGTADDIGNW